MDHALVLFSGGQDSTTCLFWALERFSQVRTVSFDYGQRHRIELDAVRKITRLAGVPSRVITISGFRELGGNALTDEIDVNVQAGPDKLPNTFVPGRNLIFLSYAAAYAYQLGIKDLVAGVCQTDYSGYPDCRQNTIEALQLALSLGMDTPFIIHTPLMDLTKAETVRLAREVGAMEALAFSHTCYNGDFPPCGECPACVLRARGFSEAGVADPLFTRVSQEGR